MTIFRSIVIAVALCTSFGIAAENQSTDDLLWRHRNLGIAFYENPDTHLEAVKELKTALDLAPNSARERVNYGLALLRVGQTEAGIAQLLQAQKQAPAIPNTWFNLGIAYKHAGDFDKAAEQLRGMIRLVPSEPVAHYNLAAVLRSKRHIQAAIPEFQKAESLNPDLAGPHFQLFTIYQRIRNTDAAARERKAFEDAKKRSEGAAIPEDMEWCYYAELYNPPLPRRTAREESTRYNDKAVSTGWNTTTSRMLILDSDGHGHSDLLVWSRDRIVLLKNGTAPVSNSGLDNRRGVVDIAAGDFNNDGLTDLCLITGNGATLFRNSGDKFVKYADIPDTAGVTKAFWLDYDHDYDLDLLLFGPKPVLMRNNGDGRFADHTSAFPFVRGRAQDAVAFAVRSDTAARDIVVSYSDRPGVLYLDKLNGVFEAHDIPDLHAGMSSLDVQDVNNDGLLDLVAYAPALSELQNSSGKLVPFKAAAAPSPIRADFNGDNREDYARILPDGSVHIYTNSSTTQRWLTVKIQGIRNVKEARDATVEIASGGYYEKRVYSGAPLAFPIDSEQDADTIRVTWPNGLIQNETRKKPGQLLSVAEAQRLSGSCPMIFTWNGKAFQFITDVLGVAPLGASSGDGQYFPVDHDEYIQIPGAALHPVDGKFQVHITEELHEVSYLDKVQLIAVDHPADIDVYTNDKFKSPPYPEFRLFGDRTKIHPLRAIEDDRTDAIMRVQKIDQRYPDSFGHNSAGVAVLHTLDLDFGKAAPENHAALVLNGWVDWADGSTFLGASQSANGTLVFPYIQVKDASGRWKTVIEDMGIPSGKPKTIVVDLSGKFLSSSREIRIVTNLCVYWDEIFLLDHAKQPDVRLTPLDASTAMVHFRGFSKPLIDPVRQQPEQFLYSQVQPISNWNPTPGFYTRYGDVRPLITAIDDKLVIMGSGDELQLEFPASNLPALSQNWTRNYLLLVDGWAKDADANTAFSQTVTPLPFHAMSAYPYKRNEHFPNDTAHAAYMRDYLTRPALRLIRPLAPQPLD